MKLSKSVRTFMSCRLAALALVTLFPLRLPAGVINFDDAAPTSTPTGWLVAQTGNGTAKWTVEQDDTAPSRPNVLKQSGVAAYPVCLRRDSALRNGFVEVKFKAILGKEDQAAGLIWRARDTNNYYVARANALEDNVCIYHTVSGKRTEEKRSEIKVAANVWHTLRVDFLDDHFTVTLDRKQVLEWEDRTFAAAGMVGLWTKADSVTLFDDFTFGE